MPLLMFRTGYIVVSLPMRDGNYVDLRCNQRVALVVSLPMRDGNFIGLSNQDGWKSVVSLPMRDGNYDTLVSGCDKHNRC